MLEPKAAQPRDEGWRRSRRQESRGRLSRAAAGLLPLGVGVGAVLIAFDLQLGTLRLPGAGMWPMLIGILVAMSAMAVLVEERKGAGYQFGRESLPILVVLASLAVFIVVFTSFGFILAAFLALTFWLRYIGHESWRLSLAMAAAGTVLFQVLFVELLGVPFPEGVIAGLWGG